MSNISGRATVGGNAWIGEHATVSGDAVVAGHAHVSGSAHVSGFVTVSGRAWVAGYAKVSGDVEIYDAACISGTAVVSEQNQVAWECFWARTGVYTLTLYMQEGGSIGFTWGCRNGDDLRAYLSENLDYAAQGLAAAPLEFLWAFEDANNIAISA